MSIPKLGPVIAIDGPAGTGKSSATRLLADRLGYVHIDTGALYRAISFLALQETGALTDEMVDRAAEISKKIHLEFRRMPRRNPANRIFADGKDLTGFIRTPEVSMASSRVSSHPQVRASLLGFQRRLGCVGKSILEGRDIGTVIFPDADVKFFLSASIEERVKRRLIELEATGGDTPTYEELKSQIIERDRGDSTRAVAPLRQAPDAIAVDTSALTLEQVVVFMEEQVRARLKK